MTVEFRRIVDHFANEAEAVVRDEDSIRRSSMEIELLNGVDEEGGQMLHRFFGEPVKSSGSPAEADVINNPVVKQLGGVYVDQTVYIRRGEDKECFYAALWPWHIRPGIVTLHLGVHDGMQNRDMKRMLSDCLEENPKQVRESA